MSCTNAYTSRYGSIAGVSVALLGTLYFAAVLLADRLRPRRADTCGPNVAAYVFAASIAGLAGVFYFGYASFVVLKTVCLLCVATYVAVIGLFVSAAVATRTPMRSLPARLAADVSTLLRTPAAAAAVVAFVVLAAGAVRWFPAETVTAAAADPATQAGAPAAADAARRRSCRNSSSSWPRSSACR